MATILNFPAMAKHPDIADLPNRVRLLRKQQGLTQAQLAKSVNLTPAHLAKLETGDRQLTMPVMEGLARALDCAVADLLLPKDGGLTAEERRLIDTYREVPAAHRATLDAVAESQQAFRHPPEVLPFPHDGEPARKRA